MVIDTSALIAMLFAEPERDAYTRAIASQSVRLVSAMSKFEAGMVAIGRYGETAAEELDRLMRDLTMQVVSFDERQADIAREAFARYGKGRHRAGLNFGDCAAYALAMAEAEPLLFKGTAFGATDVQVVAV
ncbi:MAG: type II toxin-antitoxin system VapC family toxin [Xanthobacteraceae bacterium]|jgi:ribonuclease VapC